MPLQVVTAPEGLAAHAALVTFAILVTLAPHCAAWWAGAVCFAGPCVLTSCHTWCIITVNLVHMCLQVVTAPEIRTTHADLVFATVVTLAPHCVSWWANGVCFAGSFLCVNLLPHLEQYRGELSPHASTGWECTGNARHTCHTNYTGSPLCCLVDRRRVFRWTYPVCEFLTTPGVLVP